MIEVILLEKVGRLGQIGEVVKVRPGYARNFLLPRTKALRATKSNVAFFESKRAEIEAANADAKQKAETQGKKLEGKKFTTIRQASEVGHLFGSVTVRDVADLLHDAGFEIDRQDVLLAAPIKNIGLFNVKLRLHAEVMVGITINVARNEDEAKQQEKTGQAARGRDTTAAEKAETVKFDAEAEAQKAFFEKPPEAAAEAAAPAEEAPQKKGAKAPRQKEG